MQEGLPSSPSFQNQPTFQTKQPKRGCNCKNSKCLKLYCECFSLGEYCSNCNCVSCHNNASNENIRTEAIQSILGRNPQAFRPKIATSSPLSNSKDLSKHSKGCACKRTGCLKKYCECYQAGISCSENCKCMECKNDFSCEDRYTDLPVKRICFRSEPKFGNMALVKDFLDNVVHTFGIQIKKGNEEDCCLMCEEEAFASEGNSITSTESPGKKVYTYSSDYKRIENLVYENLITALHKMI